MGLLDLSGHIKTLFMTILELVSQSFPLYAMFGNDRFRLCDYYIKETNSIF